MSNAKKPLVVITGAAGSIGRSLASEIGRDYTVVGLDLECGGTDFSCIEFDITSDDSVELALGKLRDRHGGAIASVVHLAAYFDFTGEDSPLYREVNEKGTKRLLGALQDFKVAQFVYSSTMLVHAPGSPGELIDEDSAIRPGWAYPKSKARTEEIILKNRGKIPVVMARLAGLYDEKTAVPTLSHQIARIYERDLKSHLFAGDQQAGQAFIHRNDMMDLLHRIIDRRAKLPEECVLLAGERQVMNYAALQDRIGKEVHGAEEWATFNVPQSVAKAAAWAEEHAEPVIPDDFDYGEKPFIRSFMVDMASDHYALDISRAEKLLDWHPEHGIEDGIPTLVASLKADPYGWYKANGITPPHWLQEADEVVDDPQRMRERHESQYQREHAQHLWTQWVNLGFAIWLITSPALLGYSSGLMTVSDIASGCLLLAFSFAALSPAFGWARWISAAIGCWVMSAPLIFWAPEATAYLNGMLVGALVTGFSVLVPPVTGVSALANRTGPDIPPGWNYSPSSWLQRLPVIILALVGLFASRYMAAYQLEYIDAVWEPFFGSAVAGKNGTEAIITSSVSKAWPVPDAGIGALTYMLEILVGIAGASNRWRTMPWLVVLFGLMIVPLGAVSIYFIVIQPILIGTYCTLCLIAAAAMLVQIPYSLDELIACGQFLWRKKQEGRPVLKIFFVGGTDEGQRRDRDDFRQSPSAIIGEMLAGGMSLPWNLALTILIGAGLMLTPLLFEASDGLAFANHIAGALILTVTVTALAEVARAARFLTVVIGGLLVLLPFAIEVTAAQMVAEIMIGIALMALNLRSGPIRNKYAGWDRFIL